MVLQQQLLKLVALATAVVSQVLLAMVAVAAALELPAPKQLKLTAFFLNVFIR